MSRTKERILDAAEQLFAKQGIDSTSLRAVTTAAKVNLAAVNYHFGSKAQLVQAVYARRIGPVNDERLRLLAEVEATLAPESPLYLRRVLEAFLEPALRTRLQPESERFLALVGRGHVEASEDVREHLFELFREVLTAFTAAFRRALPGLAVAEIRRRILFLVGTLMMALTGPAHLRGRRGALNKRTMAKLRDELVEFNLAGFASGREAA